MYDDGQLHVLVFDLLFMGFLVAVFFIIDSSQPFSIVVKEEFVMIAYYWDHIYKNSPMAKVESADYKGARTFLVVTTAHTNLWLRMKMICPEILILSLV